MVELDDESVLEELEYMLETNEWQSYRRFGGDGKDNNLSNNRTKRILCCRRLREPHYKHTKYNILKKYKYKHK